MKRKMICIDEKKCNGCGLCIPNCPEGAIQMIDGKARVVSESACDGLGACLGHCPQGAITIEEREAAPYDERAVMDRLIGQGMNVVRAHLEHLQHHGEDDLLAIARAVLKERGVMIPASGPHAGGHGGCPGSRVMDMRGEAAPAAGPALSSGPRASALRQWPTQLQLIPTRAPYFEDADLLVAADCTAFAYANFHERFLKGRILVMFCPKLDTAQLELYREKLTAILKENRIRSVSVVRMEVPCCGGTVSILEDAITRSGKALVIREYVISVRGDLI